MTTIILPHTLPTTGYRLRCRFKIEPNPPARRLDLEKVRVAERFVADMRKQGWVHDGRHDFRLRGPFPPVVPTTLHPTRTRTAREMLAGVLAGERFLDEAPSGVSEIGRLLTADCWEYEIAAVFIRPQILTEYPDPHEEIK